MNTCLNALLWAAVIMGVAAAGAWGAIDEDTTRTLLIVLPVAGWMAVSGRSGCVRRKAAQ
jgi:hypothetical protein